MEVNLDVERFDWISPNGNVKKKIVKNSAFRRHPGDKDKCFLRIIEVDTAAESDFVPKEGSQLSFTLGEAEDEVKRLLEQVLYTMSKDQIAQVEMVTSVGVCKLTFQLEDFQPEGTAVHKMSQQEMLTEADRIKGIASQLIKAGRFEDGAVLLRRCVKLACWGGAACPSDVYCAVMANLSLCYQHLGRPQDTVTVCTKVLTKQPHHVKSLLRRAAALDELNNPHDARLDLLQALKIEPHNTMAKELLDKVKSHLLKQKNDYAMLVKKMLQVGET